MLNNFLSHHSLYYWNSSFLEMYCRMSSLAFSMAPFCKEAYGAAKYTLHPAKICVSDHWWYRRVRRTRRRYRSWLFLLRRAMRTASWPQPWPAGLLSCLVADVPSIWSWYFSRSMSLWHYAVCQASTTTGFAFSVTSNRPRPIYVNAFIVFYNFY